MGEVVTLHPLPKADPPELPEMTVELAFLSAMYLSLTKAQRLRTSRWLYRQGR
jgi:hypothetical protein